MADLVQQWFQRKRAAGLSPWRGIVTVSHEYTRVLGPRSMYAKVTLSISANESFTFESKVTWPGENYDHHVLDGILDALFGWTWKPLLAGRFVLSNIGWHDVHSAPIA